jgi:two-component system response regulator YesN
VIHTSSRTPVTPARRWELATGVVRAQDAALVEISQVKTVVELARILRIDERALRREFKKREGMTLSKYITHVRIERARSLLLHSEMSCKEILLSVGFSRVEVGIRAFKRVTGVTMEQYRRAK